MRQSNTVTHSHPEILGGTPVFVGTRVPVRSLFDYVEGGETLDEFLRQFPSVKREQAIVLDEWFTLGLRGTRSNDYTATDLFIAEKYTTWRDSRADRREPHPFYSIPMLTLYGIAFSGVAIGVAQACLAEFMKLAEVKKGGGPFAGVTATLSQNAAVRVEVARQHAKFRSARAFTFSCRTRASQ